MRTWAYIVLTCITLGAVGMVAAEQSVRIVLKPDTETTNRNITLGDVAEFSGTSQHNLRALHGLVLGPTPRAGYSSVIEREEVARILQRHGYRQGAQYILDGAGQVMVTPVAREVAVNEYVPKAEEILYQQLVRDFTNVRLDVVGVYKPLYVPTDALEMKVKMPQRSVISKRMSVMVEIYQGDALYLKVPVWFAVDARAIGYRFKETVQASTIVNDDMLVPELVEITHIPQQIITDKRKIIGKQVVELVEKNKIIVASNLQEPVDVVAGQKVSIRVRQGAIILHASAIAVESGNRGKRIKLRNISSKEIFEGRVIDKNMVETI